MKVKLNCCDSKFLFSFLSLLLLSFLNLCIIFLVFCLIVNFWRQHYILYLRVDLPYDVSIKYMDMFIRVIFLCVMGFILRNICALNEFSCFCSGFTIHTVHPKRACPWHYKALTIFRNRDASGKAVAAAASSTNLLYRGEAAPMDTAAAAAIFTRLNLCHRISSTLFIIWQ